MPRDSAGNYTLPAGNPVVAGAVIETSWANHTMADIGNVLQDSLSRNGDGGMLVAFQNVDGTQAAPGITFTNELGTGFFRFGTADMRMTIQGTAVVRYRPDLSTPAGSRVPLQIYNGTDWVDVGVASENFTPADQIKLAGIEALAQVNRTPAEVKVAYESNADTNAFTDAEETKLAGITAGAEVNRTPAEVKVAYESNANTNAFTDADVTKLTGVEALAEVNRTPAEVKTAYESNANTDAFTDAEETKLASVTAGAEPDQTPAEIKVAYESNANTNAFTDAEETKLAGVEAGATTDQTPAEIKVSYESNADTNAFTDAEQTKLAGLSSGSYNPWAVKTTTYTAVTGDQLICNNAVTAFTVTLPASPSAGNTVILSNAGAALVTVGRNGSNINSAASDGSLPNGNSTQLVYVDATIGWKEL